jgi:hypothetical protein
VEGGKQNTCLLSNGGGKLASAPAPVEQANESTRAKFVIKNDRLVSWRALYTSPFCGEG